MKIVDLSTAVWKTELSEPTDVSIPSISAYFRYNVGDLNNLLGTCYKLSSTSLEIIDNNNCEINIDAAMIYKYMYLLSYYTRQIRANLGIGGVTQVSSVSSDGGTVKMIDRTLIGKAYIQLRKDTEETMTRLVNKYKMGHQTAVQVEGDDIYVSPQTYSEYYRGGTLYERDII